MHVIFLVTEDTVFAHAAQASTARVTLIALQTKVDARKGEVFMEVARILPTPLIVTFRALGT